MYQPDYRCWFLSAGIEFSDLGVVPFPGSSGKLKVYRNPIVMSSWL